MLRSRKREKESKKKREREFVNQNNLKASADKKKKTNQQFYPCGRAFGLLTTMLLFVINIIDEYLCHANT